MKKIATFILFAFLTACAGAQFKWSDVKRVQVGMTQQQVVELLGPPTGVSSRDGGTVYAWAHVNSFTASVKTVTIPFDKDGKVKETPAVPYSD